MSVQYYRADGMDRVLITVLLGWLHDNSAIRPRPDSFGYPLNVLFRKRYYSHPQCKRVRKLFCMDYNRLQSTINPKACTPQDVRIPKPKL